MKKLTLIRHAKSSWNHPDLSDFERPLNKRGQGDLPGLVERLKQTLPQPDRLIFSGARRTLETSRPLADAWGLDKSHYLERREAYEASLNTLLMLLQEQPDSCEHLVLVGHNPGMAELLAFLTATSPRHYPTAAFAHLELMIDSWQNLEEGCGQLQKFDYPKLHADSRH
ncbi:histidine phosphatase family protein [Marinospirillum sp.]|uniref:SixA phosphatase family protein n=1 Tax=Marinospirillum sp. TaxID=2183934 RepID=UPI00286FFBD2|nr:histidine phosphatase family protein [Marinospirillum sp.]MDR9468469.1 histidine phosphatase family protein [Marinospirillum sp.]